MIEKQEPEIPYLSRIQVLVAMGVTAILLWAVAKLWLHIGGIVVTFKLVALW